MEIACFTIHPKETADLLANCVDMSKERGKASLIYLRTSSTSLFAYGRGTYTAARDSRELSPIESAVTEVTITLEEAEELASTLRAVEGAGRKGTVVEVTIIDRDSLRIVDGTEVLCDLPDADPENLSFGEPDELSDWDEIDDMLKQIELGPSVTPPLAFAKEVLARVNKIRADSPVMDIANHPRGHAVGVALGSTFRGLVAGVDRAAYAAGGKRWPDGPGKPSHLWEA